MNAARCTWYIPTSISDIDDWFSGRRFERRAELCYERRRLLEGVLRATSTSACFQTFLTLRACSKSAPPRTTEIFGCAVQCMWMNVRANAVEVRSVNQSLLDSQVYQSKYAHMELFSVLSTYFIIIFFSCFHAPTRAGKLPTTV